MAFCGIIEIILYIHAKAMNTQNQKSKWLYPDLGFFLVYELLESKISESLVKALLCNPLFLKAFTTKAAEVCCMISLYIFSF
jgi:hypothetical protein